MGEVYRARDTKLNRDVAIKVLPDSFASDADRLARFTREAQTLASLNHPNIAQIYGLEESDGVRALVMELVEGEDLSQRIVRGPIPIDETLPIARQIAEALEAAHEHGVIHRDLKPANIKLRPDGTVKVLDFGLAKATESATGASVNLSHSPTITSPVMMTGMGVILGTAAYMAPEQAAGGVADKRSDVWAFGVVLMEMLTGRSVFTGETVSHVLASVLKSEPDWTTLPVETPAPLRRLLRRCLEKNRKRRLSDASDARLEIEEAALGTDIASVPPAARTTRREVLAWAIAGLAVIAAISVVAWPALTRPALIPMAASQFVVPAPEGLVYRPAPAISPDGRTIVFAAAGTDGRSQLWVRPLDVITARALPGTEGGTAPFWSPDSRSIGFFTFGHLKKTEVSGGLPQILASVTGSIGRAGSWNRDGIILFSEGLNRALKKVSAVDGAVVTVTTGSNPFFLPDGRHFLVFQVERSGASAAETSGQGIYVGAVDSPDTKLLVLADSAGVYASEGFLLFSRGGVLMAQPFDAVHLTTTGDAVPIADRVQVTPGFRQVVSVADDGTLLYGSSTPQETRLDWVDRRGTQVALVAPPARFGNLALSPDGTRVAFDRPPEGSAASDVWLLDLAQNISSRFTFGPYVDNVAVWSPDSRTVAFASSSGGNTLNIAQRPANASAPPQVLLKLDAPPPMFPSDWSSDGRFLAYFRTDPKTKLDQWVLPLFGDRNPIHLLHSEFNESQGQFSPDGRWIAYVSDESETPQVFVQSFPALTGKWQVSTNGGTQPRWRRDGKELFYLAPDRKLMAVTVKTVDVFERATPQPLFDTTLPPDSTRQSYSVSADGQRFLLPVPVETNSSPFTIILNWTALLKR